MLPLLYEGSQRLHTFPVPVFWLSDTWRLRVGGFTLYVFMTSGPFAAEDAVSFTVPVCCIVSLEKSPEPCSDWLTGMKICCSSYVAVSSSLCLPADCPALYQAAEGSILELIFLH